MKWILSQLLSKLPLLIMLVLTLMSFVLLQKTDGGQSSESAAKKPYDMDLYLKNFTIHYYDKTGAIKTQLQSAYAEHSNARETLTTRPLSMLHQSGARSYIATSNEAVFTDDSETAQLKGRAIIQSFDPSKTPAKNIRLESDKIDMQLTLEQVKSSVPSVLWSDGNQSSSNQLFYDSITGKMTLSGRVKATLLPKR